MILVLVLHTCLHFTMVAIESSYWLDPRDWLQFHTVFKLPHTSCGPISVTPCIMFFFPKIHLNKTSQLGLRALCCRIHGHGFDPHQCVWTWPQAHGSKKAQLPCWPLYSKQMLHQRWFWGIHCRQVRKWWIHPDFETQDRYHQKCKTAVSVAPQKGPVSSKSFKKMSMLGQ